MINFMLSDFAAMMIYLSEEHERTGDVIASKQVPPDNLVGGMFLERVNKYLTQHRTFCGSCGFLRSLSRFDRIFNLLNAKKLTYGILRNELVILHHAVEDDIKQVLIYYYPPEKAALVRQFDTDWKLICQKFPKTQQDASYGVDCFALGHNDAAVFHFMRVMEMGVQAYGKRLGVNISKSNPGKKVSELTWGSILAATKEKLDKLPQGRAQQKRRYERLMEIQSHLHAVKDAWRNPTMHPRAQGYTDSDAQNIMNHVRTFMLDLAEVV